MMPLPAWTRSFGRIVVMVLLVAFGTILLMRCAPGYYSDIREMDAQHAEVARTSLQAEQLHGGSVLAIARSAFGGWLHGDLGRSRQYGVPVRELIQPRLKVSGALLGRGVLFGWVVALCAALPLSTLRRWSGILGVPFSLLLAVPVGAMATLCLVSGVGGPVLVLVLLLVSRDFKFLHRALETAWEAPHVLTARAQGLSVTQLLRTHVLPSLWPQLIALALLSFVTALSAIVPVEVIFDLPGIGQLAWVAAMNRDLPVLLACTILVTIAVALASSCSRSSRLEGEA